MSSSAQTSTTSLSFAASLCDSPCSISFSSQVVFTAAPAPTTLNFPDAPAQIVVSFEPTTLTTLLTTTVTVDNQDPKGTPLILPPGIILDDSVIVTGASSYTNTDGDTVNVDVTQNVIDVLDDFAEAFVDSCEVDVANVVVPRPAGVDVVNCDQEFIDELEITFRDAAFLGELSAQIGQDSATYKQYLPDAFFGTFSLLAAALGNAIDASVASDQRPPVRFFCFNSTVPFNPPDVFDDLATTFAGGSLIAARNFDQVDPACTPMVFLPTAFFNKLAFLETFEQEDYCGKPGDPPFTQLTDNQYQSRFATQTKLILHVLAHLDAVTQGAGVGRLDRNPENYFRSDIEADNFVGSTTAGQNAETIALVMQEFYFRKLCAVVPF